jgi:hypothetical protein
VPYCFKERHMPTKYVPGQPNPYFPRHKYCGIPVNRNIKPINECDIHHYVGPAATVEKSVAVDILTPEHLWVTFQTEAEDMLKANGQWIKDAKELNRRINAGYAKLWLADNRFQWAGLAAFASKQVGCGLLHSADLVEVNRREREQIQKSFAQAAVSGGEYATITQMGTEVCAGTMYDRLAFGNKHLFLDIYPLHRFYMERDWKEFTDHLEKRQNKRYAVEWRVDRSVLPFAKPSREIRRGFGQIETGNLKTSVELLAQHEQVNILQTILYSNTVMRTLLAFNQLAWASDFPTGNYEEIKLTLSAECKVKEDRSVFFWKNACAKLWDADQRMAFVRKAADRFNVLLNSPERPQVEASIQAIAAGGGVA